MTTTWAVNPAQFWLRGETPDEPIAFEPSLGMWNVYGYPEAMHIITDPSIFSSDIGRVVPVGDANQRSLIQLDPPAHRKLRNLVSHAFTPKVVADLEPQIRQLAHELLDPLTERAELVTDLTYPLPVIVIAELLGVPSSDRALFKQWVDALLEESAQFSLARKPEELQQDMEKAMSHTKNLIDYLSQHAAERRKQPREDLLTKLVQAEVDGERLTEPEIANFANVLLLAGHITTTMLLGNTVLCLDSHPEQAAEVRANHAMIPAAIEESLRYLSPIAALSRVTNTDTTVGGVDVPADAFLMVWLAAANRDARQYPNPHTFDPTRDPNPHLAFGRGIHFCLGAPLARLEGRIALSILLERFPHLRLDPQALPEFVPAPSMTGVRKLPLLLTP